VDEEPLVLASAFKHGLSEDDILHAWRYSHHVATRSRGRRMIELRVGPAAGGVALIEVDVIVWYGQPAIVHAMRARSAFLEGRTRQR
jgi:hypothetical protein